MHIRRADPNDAAGFLTSRNMPESAFWSGYTVSEAEHQVWFQRSVESPDHCLLVLVDEQDRMVGYARYAAAVEARVSLAIQTHEQGRGYGFKLLAALEAEARQDEIARLVAVVHPANTRSFRVFQKAGYQLRDTGYQQLVKGIQQR